MLLLLWWSVFLLFSQNYAVGYLNLINLQCQIFQNHCLHLQATDDTAGGYGRTQIQSLEDGNWVKFICGASNQDAPLIRNMCFVYTLAGVDCIDVSASIAIVNAAKEGIDAALSQANNQPTPRPLLMISINDDRDVHFRKAFFDADLCPPDCPRPCEKVCPAFAIPPSNSNSAMLNKPLGDPAVLPLSDDKDNKKLVNEGVLSDKCYGCGRCIPICPLGLIEERPYVSDRAEVNQLLSSGLVDAIEIHTHVGHEFSFAKLWDSIGSVVLENVQIIAVSFPNMKNNTSKYLQHLHSIMISHQENRSVNLNLIDPTVSAAWRDFSNRPNTAHIWQSDGRPMSGDIGQGATHASVDLASALLCSTSNHHKHSNDHDDGESLASDLSLITSLNHLSSVDEFSPVDNHIQTTEPESILHEDSSRDESSKHVSDQIPPAKQRTKPSLSPRHYVQLAGGTNDASYKVAKRAGLIGTSGFGGFAFGGYARAGISKQLQKIENMHPGGKIEDFPQVYDFCLTFARNLVGTVKCDNNLKVGGVRNDIKICNIQNNTCRFRNKPLQ